MDQSLVEIILGPVGGAAAFAFGTGCALGYGFAIRTLHKYKIPALEQRIADLTDEITRLREMLGAEQDKLGNLERMLRPTDD